MDAFQCPDGASACAEDWHRRPSQQRNKQTWPPLPCSRSTHRGGLPPAASPTSCCADRCSVLCAGSSSSLIRAWRRGAWELCVEERSNGVSSRVQNTRDPSPVARGRRKGPSEPAAIPHVNPTVQLRSNGKKWPRGWTVFHLPSTPGMLMKYRPAEAQGGRCHGRQPRRPDLQR
jgi:hypothetical protein